MDQCWRGRCSAVPAGQSAHRAESGHYWTVGHERTRHPGPAQYGHGLTAVLILPRGGHVFAFGRPSYSALSPLGRCHDRSRIVNAYKSTLLQWRREGCHCSSSVIMLDTRRQGALRRHSAFPQSWRVTNGKRSCKGIITHKNCCTLTFSRKQDQSESDNLNSMCLRNNLARR